jgi:YfiR/HmsC-like
MDRMGNNPARGTLLGRARISFRALALVCIVPLTSSVARPSLAQTAANEYQIKAAFVFHFAQLVDWPAEALSARTASLNLCIFDDDPGREQFQSEVDGKVIEARVLHVHLVGQSQDLKKCNILFLGRAEARQQRAILGILRGLPVLTIGETTDFLNDGGMIRFHIEQDKIRFDINLGAAELSHLKISSRLLLLATSVTGGAAGGEGRSNAYQ